MAKTMRNGGKFFPALCDFSVSLGIPGMMATMARVAVSAPLSRTAPLGWAGAKRFAKVSRASWVPGMTWHINGIRCRLASGNAKEAPMKPIVLVLLSLNELNLKRGPIVPPPCL